MKRILVASVLTALVVGTAQGQGAGQGSNVSGPGGGGSGVSGGIGAFVPSLNPLGGVTMGSEISPAGAPPAAAGFATATAPLTVSVGGTTVSIPAAAQNAVGGAIASGNASGFVASLGAGIPGPLATALGQALVGLGEAGRTRAANTTSAAVMGVRSAVASAIEAFNNALNALPAGQPIPASLIAARVAIGGYYLGGG